MPHSLKIINKYLIELKKDYDLDNLEYSLLIERPLAHPGFNISPDIQIIRNGRIICVVEIGYTRPKKFKIYKELNIPDIRWIDKEDTPGDHLHMVTFLSLIADNHKSYNPIYNQSKAGCIRTSQKCLNCNISFPNNFICPNCQSQPNRFFIDLWWKKRIKIYSDPQGIPIDSYLKAQTILNVIRLQINSGDFLPENWRPEKSKKRMCP